MAKLTYANKSALNENPNIAVQNKITDDDMNEIKTVVNENDDNVGDLTTLKTTTKSSIVGSINELVDSEVYSTTEVKTNKVYKGKPVYRKMFENIPLENAGSATNKTLGVLENFKESVIMYAEIKTPTNVIYTGYASNAVYIEPWIDANGNAKIIYVFNGTGQKGKAIFEYTKTTD